MKNGVYHVEKTAEIGGDEVLFDYLHPGIPQRSDVRHLDGTWVVVGESIYTDYLD